MALLFAPFVSGVASFFVMLVAGNFVTSYLDALANEWVTNNEWLLQTILRRLVRMAKYSYLALTRRQLPNQNLHWDVPDNVDVPSPMICVITFNLFMDPWILHDMPFEKRFLERWVLEHGTHPLNRAMKVSISELRPADRLRELCHEFAAQHNIQALS